MIHRTEAPVRIIAEQGAEISERVHQLRNDKVFLDSQEITGQRIERDGNFVTFQVDHFRVRFKGSNAERSQRDRRVNLPFTDHFFVIVGGGFVADTKACTDSLVSFPMSKCQIEG